MFDNAKASSSIRLSRSDYGRKYKVLNHSQNKLMFNSRDLIHIEITFIGFYRRTNPINPANIPLLHTPAFSKMLAPLVGEGVALVVVDVRLRVEVDVLKGGAKPVIEDVVIVLFELMDEVTTMALEVEVTLSVVLVDSGALVVLLEDDSTVVVSAADVEDVM